LILVCALLLISAVVEARKGQPPAKVSSKHGKPHHDGAKRDHTGKHSDKTHPHPHKPKHSKPIPAPTPAPVSSSLGGDIGDRLLRTYGVFKNQPLTADDAQTAGFTMYTDSCTQFGYGYAKGTDGSGPSKGDSAILFFTAGGQLAGFGSRMYGEAPQALIDQGYWMATEDGDSYDIVISTRDPGMICSGETDENDLGDRLWINGIMEIPTAMDDAQSAGWVEGNCIPKMGIHHAFDLNYPSSQSWNASSLVPVMPMYHNGKISAVLLASSDAQRIEPFGDWEGPFPNFLFCKNWCANTGCTFPGVSLWTTMHWLFEDPKLNTCDGAKCVVSL